MILLYFALFTLSTTVWDVWRKPYNSMQRAHFFMDMAIVAFDLAMFVWWASDKAITLEVPW